MSEPKRELRAKHGRRPAPPAAGLARRRRRRADRRGAAGRHPGRRAAGPDPCPGPVAAAAAAAGAALRPGRIGRGGRTDPPGLAPLHPRPWPGDPGDRREHLRRARARPGRRARARALAAGRRRADRRRPARQPDDRSAPAGRADRPRSGAAERRRRHALAGQDQRGAAAHRHPAPLQAELLGRGAHGRRLAAGAHARDLVPHRAAVRRRLRTSMRRC